MAEDNGAMADEETIHLTVDPDTIIKGVKLDDTPGVSRSVVFHRKLGGGFKPGTLRDVTGLRWGGEGPIIMDPMSFVPDEYKSPSTLVSAARHDAKKEDEDPDEWEETALEVWETDARRGLKEEVVVEPRFPEENRTVYHIEYESDE